MLGILIARVVRLISSVMYFHLIVAIAIFTTSPALAADALSGKVLLEETVDYQCTYPAPSSYVDVVKGSGSIPLVLPEQDGPIKGKGQFIHKGSGYSFAGPLILDGKLQNGVLIFPFPKGYSGGMQVYNRKDIVSIRAEKNAVTVLHPEPNLQGVRCTGDFTWKLTKPQERWRITINDEGTNVSMTAGNMIKEAGLTVGVERVVDVTIEKDKFKEGKGTARIVSMKGHSIPQNIYNCKPAATTIVGTGTDIEVERLDQTKWTKRFNPPKTPQDAELKKQWQKLKKQKTPVIFPQDFAVQGKLSGKILDLRLPEKSGYTVGIYCRLNPKINISKTKAKSVAERMDVDRSLLGKKFQVTLKEGWHYEESWTVKNPGRPTRNGTTKISVESLN